MNKKANKEVQVKKGQIYELKGNSVMNFFTKGKRYEVESVEYDNGKETTDAIFIDDDGDRHPISEDFLEKNFKLSKIQ